MHSDALFGESSGGAKPKRAWGVPEETEVCCVRRIRLPTVASSPVFCVVVRLLLSLCKFLFDPPREPYATALGNKFFFENVAADLKAAAEANARA